MNKETILTGIRANGELTLGNYLGTILQMVQLQKRTADSHQMNMFLADMHSIISEVDYKTLQSQIMQTLKYFVAAGIDYELDSTYIYRQSHIQAHGELAWILSCFTSYGEASRMVEFKDKSARIGSEGVTVGLFSYPILMTADILLYDALWVPLGEDQRQHLELARTIAQRMNTKLDQQLFTIPHESAKQVAFAEREKPVRIRSLRNPEKKMSKSVDDPAGTILLSDSPEAAAKKVLGATTDSVGTIKFDFDTQPGISNLVQILALLSERTLSEVSQEWTGKSSYNELKQATADAVKAFLSSFQERLAAVDETKLLAKLEQSEAEMAKLATDTLQRVQKAVGLRP